MSSHNDADADAEKKKENEQEEEEEELPIRTTTNINNEEEEEEDDDNNNNNNNNIAFITAAMFLLERIKKGHQTSVSTTNKRNSKKEQEKKEESDDCTYNNYYYGCNCGSCNCNGSCYITDQVEWFIDEWNTIEFQNVLNWMRMSFGGRRRRRRRRRTTTTRRRRRRRSIVPVTVSSTKTSPLPTNKNNKNSNDNNTDHDNILLLQQEEEEVVDYRTECICRWKKKNHNNNNRWKKVGHHTKQESRRSCCLGIQSLALERSSRLDQQYRTRSEISQLFELLRPKQTKSYDNDDGGDDDDNDDSDGLKCLTLFHWEDNDDNNDNDNNNNDTIVLPILTKFLQDHPTLHEVRWCATTIPTSIVQTLKTIPQLQHLTVFVESLVSSSLLPLIIVVPSSLSTSSSTSSSSLTSLSSPSQLQHLTISLFESNHQYDTSSPIYELLHTLGGGGGGGGGGCQQSQQQQIISSVPPPTTALTDLQLILKMNHSSTNGSIIQFIHHVQQVLFQNNHPSLKRIRISITLQQQSEEQSEELSTTTALSKLTDRLWLKLLQGLTTNTSLQTLEFQLNMNIEGGDDTGDNHDTDGSFLSYSTYVPSRTVQEAMVKVLQYSNVTVNHFSCIPRQRQQQQQQQQWEEKEKEKDKLNRNYNILDDSPPSLLLQIDYYLRLNAFGRKQIITITGNEDYRDVPNSLSLSSSPKPIVTPNELINLLCGNSGCSSNGSYGRCINDLDWIYFILIRNPTLCCVCRGGVTTME